MRSQVHARAEIAKLSGLLGCPADSLSYLEKAAPEDLRALRERTTDVLFDANLGVLQRMAAAARLIPLPILARIAQSAFGPLLCARIAGLIDADRAAEVAERLPSPFLADVATALDPRRATDVIARLSVAKTAEVARELDRRGEIVTMGRFVGHLTDAALAGCVAEIGEPDLLRIAFVIEGRERLDQVVGLLSRERQAGLLRAAERAQLWLEALELLEALSEPRRRELVQVTAEQDGALPGLLRAAREQGAESLLDPLFAS